MNDDIIDFLFRVSQICRPNCRIPDLNAYDPGETPHMLILDLPHSTRVTRLEGRLMPVKDFDPGGFLSRQIADWMSTMPSRRGVSDLEYRRKFIQDVLTRDPLLQFGPSPLKLFLMIEALEDFSPNLLYIRYDPTTKISDVVTAIVDDRVNYSLVDSARNALNALVETHYAKGSS